ncbi:MAG: hypothetical protein ACJ77E_11935 [Gaiellaceae bacterium]
MLLRVSAATAAALALAACGGSKHEAPPKSDLPPGCSVEQVDAIVQSFLAHPTVAPPSLFEVYATQESDGRRFLARTPAKTLVHLRRRLALGERSRLIQLRVAPQDFNHVRITFQLTRFAPDFRARGIHQRLARGAGTIDCAHGKVAAWVTKGP